MRRILPSPGHLVFPDSLHAELSKCSRYFAGDHVSALTRLLVGPSRSEERFLETTHSLVVFVVHFEAS